MLNSEIDVATSVTPPTAPDPSKSSVVVGTIVWTTLFILVSLPAVIVGYENATHFSGSAIDGPFQLYNALRRIQAGFRPGVDFQFFHGLGLPFLLYAPYRLFGGGLPGSQLAREVITTVIQPLVFLVAFRVFTGSWRKSFALSTLAMCAALILRLSAVLFALNGMVGLRAAIPTLLPVAAYAIRRPWARAVAIGVGLGIALFLSTEQGLAVLLAFTLVATVAALRGEARGRAFLALAGSIAIAGAVYIACLTAVGGVAGMQGALRYNLRLVPMDQYWYFGAPPNVFVPSWSAGLRMLWAAPLVGSAVASLPRFRNETELLLLAALGAFVYGGLVIALFGQRLRSFVRRRGVVKTGVPPAEA